MSSPQCGGVFWGTLRHVEYPEGKKHVQGGILEGGCSQGIRPLEATVLYAGVGGVFSVPRFTRGNRGSFAHTQALAENDSLSLCSEPSLDFPGFTSWQRTMQTHKQRCRGSTKAGDFRGVELWDFLPYIYLEMTDSGQAARMAE